MKNNKILVIILVLFLNIVVGFMVGQNIKSGDSEYEGYIETARSYTEQGLCSKAIDEYNKAIAIEDTLDVRIEMINTYEKGIDIGEFTKTYNIYADIESMVDLYRYDAKLYETMCTFFNKYGEYQKCADYLMQARDLKVTSEAIDALREEIRYKYARNYSMYTDVAPQLSGVYTVKSDETYKFIDTDGSTVLDDKFIWASNFNEGYAVVKKLSPEGVEQMFVLDEEGARQFYLPETADYSSGAAKITVSDNESFIVFAIRDNGKFYYVNINGEKLFDGAEFEFAGRFRNNIAAVKESGKWYIIDYTGKKISETAFDDIILNEFDECAAKGLIIAKSGEKYSIYTLDSKTNAPVKKGNFECDYAKAFVDDAAAFKSGEKWGYVDAEGNIIIEPQYDDAQSFSNGLAAVKVDPIMFADEENADEELVPISETATEAVTEAATEKAAEEKTTATADEEASTEAVTEATTEATTEAAAEETEEIEEEACWAVINKDNRVVFEEGFQDTDYLSSNGLWFVKFDGYWSAIQMYYTGK